MQQKQEACDPHLKVPRQIHSRSDEQSTPYGHIDTVRPTRARQDRYLEDEKDEAENGWRWDIQGSHTKIALVPDPAEPGRRRWHEQCGNDGSIDLVVGGACLSADGRCCAVLRIMARRWRQRRCAVSGCRGRLQFLQAVTKGWLRRDVILACVVKFLLRCRLDSGWFPWLCGRGLAWVQQRLNQSRQITYLEQEYRAVRVSPGSEFCGRGCRAWVQHLSTCSPRSSHS